MKWSLQILEYWVGLHWVPLSDTLENALIHFSSLSGLENGKLAQRRLKTNIQGILKISFTSVIVFLNSITISMQFVHG